METTSSTRVPAALWVAWATALAASAASVYFIEILHNPAATLCWLSRMLIFGVLLVLSVGIVRRDRGAWRYALPFVVLGLPVSVYQQLVHWDVIHVATATCSTSVVCTTKYFDLLGFITQATVCLTAFGVVAVCLWLLARKGN